MTDVQQFLDTFYKESTSYKVGLNQMKNMYQRYNGTYYTDAEFEKLMDTLGYKLKNECYKLSENKKSIWGKKGLMANTI